MNGSEKREKLWNIWYYLISNHSHDAHCFPSIYGEKVLELSEPCDHFAISHKDTIEIRMQPKH